MSIRAVNLRKSFGAARAVDGVGFEIPGPGVVGLIGPNGSGKTTILRMLATFLAPATGRIRIAGHDVATDPDGARRSIGYLPEAVPGHSEARVEEFLEFRARLKGIPRSGRRSEIDRALEACQLMESRRRIIGKLSQGFRRRVGFADALLGRPPVLLLDEPTVGLDPLQVRQMRGILRELSSNATVLLSTHLLAEAEAVCDRALIVVRGRIAADVRLAELGHRAKFELTLRAPPEECAARVAAISGVDEVEPVVRARVADLALPVTTLRVTGSPPDLREHVVRECVERGWGVQELRNVDDDLESHFVRVALELQREAA